MMRNPGISKLHVILMTRVKSVYIIFLTGILACTTLLSGCENDLATIKKLSGNETTKPIEQYTGVDIIFSDSAKVKAHLTAPLMLNYKVKKPYTEMPKGVKVIIYDTELKVISTIVADYAIRHELEKKIEFRKNVIVTNAQGDVFNSDELIWDEATKLIHSDKLVHIKFANGNITDGTTFVSDEGFNHYTMTQATAVMHVNSQDISH